MAESDGWTNSVQRDVRPNISDLSFILHPCHEVSTPEKNINYHTPEMEPHDFLHQSLVEKACINLGLSSTTVNELYVQRYEAVFISRLNPSSQYDDYKHADSFTSPGFKLTSVIWWLSTYSMSPPLKTN